MGIECEYECERISERNKMREKIRECQKGQQSNVHFERSKLFGNQK